MVPKWRHRKLGKLRKIFLFKCVPREANDCFFGVSSVGGEGQDVELLLLAFHLVPWFHSPVLTHSSVPDCLTRREQDSVIFRRWKSNEEISSKADFFILGRAMWPSHFNQSFVRDYLL